MTHPAGSGHRKTAAGILGMLLLVVVLFSAFFIAAEADHHCTGEDCPVCACLQQCEKTLHQIGGGLAALSAVIVPAVIILISVVLLAFAIPHKTPVSGKISLNN